MNEEELLALAQGAIERGANAEEVDARIAELSRFPNVFALQSAVESAELFVQSEELAEIGERPLRSFVGAVGQGLTFNFLDEIIGAVSPAAGRRAERAQDIRQEQVPGGTTAAEMAGSFLLPTGPLAASAKFAPGATKGALTGAGRGGLFGALGGAAVGAGSAEEGERLEAAQRGAAVGGVTGAALGAPTGLLGGILGSAAGRGQRVAEGMRDLSDLTGRRSVSKGKVAAERSRISEELYRPIQEQFAQVDDPRISVFLQDVSADPILRTRIPRPVRNAVGASRPSFEDLQDIRSALRKGGREGSAKADELTELMEDLVGEPLREADRAWARINQGDRAFDRGWSLFDREADLITENRNALRTVAEREFFDEGRLSRITAKLGERERDAVGLLKKYMDAGEDTRRRVASLFPGGESGTAFQTLQKMIAREARNAAIADFFNSSVKSAAIGAVGGGIAGGLLSDRENR